MESKNMNQKQIEEKAAYYLTCQREGFTLEQKKELASWLFENEAHQKAFNKMQKTQALFLSLDENCKQQLLSEIHAEIANISLWEKYKSYAVAALFLLCIGVGIFQTNNYLNYKIPHTFHTQQQTKYVALPDGSTLTLDATTQAKVEYLKDKRVVQLHTGKILFDVQKNTHKPFIIELGSTQVKVLGTRFEIENFDNQITVKVIDGVVSVQKIIENSSLKELAQLSKGKQFSYLANKDTFLIKNIDIASIASWEKGILLFDNEPVKKALNEFKRYHTLEIYFDESIANLPITGSFPIKNYDKFLIALSKIHAISLRKKNNVIYLQKK